MCCRCALVSFTDEDPKKNPKCNADKKTGMRVSKNNLSPCSWVLGSFGVLSSLVFLARYLGERMLLLKLCDVNRGWVRGCRGREALGARESLESTMAEELRAE
jgi:hypothetical protein